MDAGQAKSARKVAFQLGVARYMHEHDMPAQLKAAALAGAFNDAPDLTKVANPLLMAAALPGLVSFGAGSAGGTIGGHAYGMASGLSPETVSEREFELAEAATQQLIDELKARQHNKSIKRTLSGAESGQVRHPALSWAR